MKQNGVTKNGHIPRPATSVSSKEKEAKNKKAKSSPKKGGLTNSKSTKDIKSVPIVRMKEQNRPAQEKRILDGLESRGDSNQEKEKEKHKQKKSQEKLIEPKKSRPKIQNFFLEGQNGFPEGPSLRKPERKTHKHQKSAEKEKIKERHTDKDWFKESQDKMKSSSRSPFRGKEKNLIM